MSDRKTFEYGGYHFTPIRKFHKKEGDFFAISKRLASDPNLGLCTYQDRQKAPYDYKGFYTVATDKECDVFRCEENGLLYVPGENELFIYHEPKQKKRCIVHYDTPPTLQCAYCPIVTGRLTGCIKKLISALKTLNLCTEKS